MIKQAQETLHSFFNTNSVVCAYFTIAKELACSERFEKQYKNAIMMLEKLFKDVPIKISDKNALPYKGIGQYYYYSTGLLLEYYALDYSESYKSGVLLSPYDTTKVEADHNKAKELIVDEFNKSLMKKNTIKLPAKDKDDLIISLNTLAKTDPILKYQIAAALGRNIKKTIFTQSDAPLYKHYEILSHIDRTLNIINADIPHHEQERNFRVVSSTYYENKKVLKNFIIAIGKGKMLDMNYATTGFYYISTKDGIKNFIQKILKERFYTKNRGSSRKAKLRDFMMHYATKKEHESIFNIKKARINDVRYSCAGFDQSCIDIDMKVVCSVYRQLKEFILREDTPQDVKDFFVLNRFLRKEDLK